MEAALPKVMSEDVRGVTRELRGPIPDGLPAAPKDFLNLLRIVVPSTARIPDASEWVRALEELPPNAAMVLRSWAVRSGAALPWAQPTSPGLRLLPPPGGEPPAALVAGDGLAVPSKGSHPLCE